AASVIIANRQPPPRPAATLRGPAGQAPCSAAFSPGSTTLAVAGCRAGVSVWDIATRRRVATLTSPRCVGGEQVIFSPDGRALAQFGGHAVSPTGRHYHPATCLWDMATRRETTLTDSPLLTATSAQGAFSPDGTTLAVADNSGKIYLWNLATRRVTATVPASRYCAPLCPIAFSPDGTMLAVGQSDPSGDRGHVYLWNLAARRWAGTLTDPGRGIGSLAFGRNGILAVGADDDHAYLWDVAARRLTGTIAPPINVAAGNASISKGPKGGGPYPGPGYFDKSTTAALSPDGTTLAIDVSFGYGTYVYHAATRNRVATLPYPYPAGRYHFAAGLVFSPDGTMLAVDAADPSLDNGHVYLWDLTRNRD
ncbi:MAG: hypothetical protein LBI49_23185, partial [Nocardiopsaceae bacterium]|nr:hypothetical protein [Nocardiopsaceae bacterium]